MTSKCFLLVAFVVGCSNSSNSPSAASTPNAASSPSEGVQTHESGESRPPDVDGGTNGVAIENPTSPPDTSADATPPVPDGACAGPADQKLRALVIGNSQIFYWNLPRVLTEVSETAPPLCPRIAAEGFTRGGEGLWGIWTHGDDQGRSLDATIRDGKYDVVVIAESIGLVDLPPPKTDFVTYANMIIDAARAAGAMPVLYATPYPSQPAHKGFVEMAEPQIALGLERGVRVAAGGLAWLRVWNELPTLDLHFTDRAHPNYKGSIISAMEIYSVITGNTSLGLSPPPRTDCEPYPGKHEPCPTITSAEVAVFRNAAWAEAIATGIK